MSDEQRASSPNLVLLCYDHHVITNDVDKYPVLVLQAMESEHEAGSTGPARAILDGDAGQNAVEIVQVGTANRAVAAPTIRPSGK